MTSMQILWNENPNMPSVRAHEKNASNQNSIEFMCIIVGFSFPSKSNEKKTLVAMINECDLLRFERKAEKIMLAHVRRR